MQRFDLIIIGGGLVGAGLALALKPSGLKIALIDARLPSHDDPRLFALNESSCQFIKNIGCWSSLQQHAAEIRKVHVSYQKHFGAVRLACEDVNLQTLGHVIPAYRIEKVFHDALSQCHDITLFCPTKLQTIDVTENGVNVTIETENGEHVLETPLAIGADGTESTVRTQLNIKTNIVDYHQSAIVSRITLNRTHQHIAYERFCAKGTIAMLPLLGNECASIFSVDDTFAVELMTLSDKDYLSELQKSFGYRLGRLEKISKRYTFPLRMVTAEKLVAKGVYLIGNAAHTLHPVAAQGFNLAIYEIAKLADALIQKKQLSVTELRNISEQTESQRNVSINVSHRMSALFATESPMVRNLIQMGMIGLDIATPIKKYFIKKMTGKTGFQPRLLLG